MGKERRKPSLTLTTDYKAAFRNGRPRNSRRTLLRTLSLPYPICDPCRKTLNIDCTHWTSFVDQANISYTTSRSSRLLLSPRLEAATQGYSRLPDSNEARPSTAPQKMESGGAGADVAMAASMQPPDRNSVDAHTSNQPVTINLSETLNFTLDHAPDTITTTNTAQETTFVWQESPFAQRFVNPFQASNERTSAVENAAPSVHVHDAQQAPRTPSLPEANLIRSVTNMDDSSAMPSFWPDNTGVEEQISQDMKPSGQLEASMWEAPSDTMPSEPEQPNPADMTGYAQLVFPDGEYLLSTTSVSLGRDDKVFKQYLRTKQAAKQAAKLDRAAQRTAEEALQQYRQEPSQPSQQGEEISSKSSHSLEGRPAPGLPSTFSEQGGIVSMGDDGEGAQKRRRRQKQLLRHASGHSSSTNSIAPANLHTFTYYDELEANAQVGDDGNVTPFVPVHPTVLADIGKISREHLLIKYNRNDRHWELHVIGNSAFVHNELCYESTGGSESWEDGTPKVFCKDAIVPLTHNSEIIVSSLTIKFRLPQGKAKSTFDSDSEIEDEGVTNSSPARRLSVAMNNGGSDEDEAESSEEEVALATLAQKEKQQKKKKEKKPRKDSKQKSGIKLKLKATKPEPEAPVQKLSPEASKKPDKGKKPMKSLPAPEQAPITQAEDPAVQPPEQTKSPVQQQVSEVPVGTEEAPAPTLIYEPGSLLGDVPPDQLPEKRKGPGRPPKNGLVSKRDMGLVKRRQKEMEKIGQVVPHFDDLVKIIRAENKIKEAAQKAAQRGEVPPATPNGTYAVQSIEISEAQLAAALTNATNAAPSSLARPSGQGGIDDGAPGSSADAEARDEAKRQRTYRSPSPMKPKEECTEEELKKPAHTYYHTLDEILSEGPEEGLELQQIYDKVCKKYPYYRYGVESSGWQSSVRHNLKQHDRFSQVSKQGKGWLWAINQEIPFDKEKKRKPTPPPQPQRPQPYQMQNGGMPQQQYGATQYGYGNLYGQQPPADGQQPFTQTQRGQQPGATGPYDSPYGRPNQNQPYGAQPGGQGFGGNATQPPYPYQVCMRPFQPRVGGFLSLPRGYIPPDTAWPMRSWPHVSYMS
jgi:hypothetical protein